MRPGNQKSLRGTADQAYQFIDMGSAEIGFIALSQLTDNSTGSRWIVSQVLYTPIRQNAVLLKKGASNEAGNRIHGFLERT